MYYIYISISEANTNSIIGLKLAEKLKNIQVKITLYGYVKYYYKIFSIVVIALAHVQKNTYLQWNLYTNKEKIFEIIFATQKQPLITD